MLAGQPLVIADRSTSLSCQPVSLLSLPEGTIPFAYLLYSTCLLTPLVNYLKSTHEFVPELDFIFVLYVRDMLALKYCIEKPKSIGYYCTLALQFSHSLIGFD